MKDGRLKLVAKWALQYTIFPQRAGKPYGFLLFVGQVFGGELVSLLLYRVLWSRMRWRSLARVLCKAIRLPCCVSKNCGFPKVRTHAPATLEPWVPMEPNVPMLSNCRFPSIENLRFPT
jgi:hypothetical protein